MRGGGKPLVAQLHAEPAGQAVARAGAGESILNAGPAVCLLGGVKIKMLQGKRIG